MIRPGASLIAILLLFSPALSRTWHIQPDGSGDAPTIQAGIDSAAVGDTVLLHEGTYTGTGNRDVDPGTKQILVRSLNGPDATIVDCEGAGRGFHYQGGLHRTLSGITIKNGTATTGGGILVDGDAYVTIRDCRVLSCVATNWHGGGIRIGGARARIENCRIADNSALSGGGISCGGSVGHLVEIDSCLVHGNIATSPPGYSRGGGGIYLLYENGGGVDIVHSTIAGNLSMNLGGGIYNSDGEYSFHSIRNSIIRGNCAPVAYDIEGEGAVHLLQCAIDPLGAYGVSWGVDEEMVFEDPLFCGPADCESAPSLEGDYTLDAASPCLPGNNPIGPFLIGALGEGCDVFTSVAEGGSMPERALGLFAMPNPSTGEVSVRYSLPSSSPVPVVVYDIRGRVVRALEGKDASGVLTWDGRTASGADVPAGVYFVRVDAGRRAVTERVVVVR